LQSFQIFAWECLPDASRLPGFLRMGRGGSVRSAFPCKAWERERKNVGTIENGQKRKEDPIFRPGTTPVSCNTPDASENTDKYIYSENL